MANLRERLGWPGRLRFRRLPRLIGWNVLILMALLVLAACGAELYLRATTPFRTFFGPTQLVAGVGVMYRPHAEVRHTNGRDFWQVSRANSLGFLDREPPSAERAAASCHVALIGDSFVEAKEVPIAEKAQVALEAMAAREAPELDVTTSAFGRDSTGQINQLPFYDVYARPLSPDLLVLVAVPNDFRDNSSLLYAWYRGWHPDWLPFLSARPGADGEMEFRAPSGPAEVRANELPVLSARPESTGRRVERVLRERSYLADWLWSRFRGSGGWRTPEQRLAWAELISRDPRHATFMEGWDPRERGLTERAVLQEDPPPIFREALDVTAFALEQFRERAGRDGATLVILAAYGFGGEGDPPFDLLRGLAARSGGEIPVISQHDHVVDAGGEIEDLHWAHDNHWSATGHRWAAAAIWEWLRRNPEVCG